MQNFRNPLILTAPKIYLDTTQLPAGGGAVSEWNSFATAEVGGAGLPTLKTDETYRYVRFGTTDATISKGNYLNLGTQTWNLQNGFTFVGVVRLYENKSFQRIFDLGNAGTSSAFLLYRQLNVSNYLGSVVYSGTTQNISTSQQNLTHGSWMLLVLRIPSANLVETFRDPSSSLLDNKVTGNGTITNYSSRTTTDNSIAKSTPGSYSCLDVREIAFYDRSITDSELSDVVGHLHYKYFSDPLLRKGPNIHLDASQLPQLSLDNTNVSSWNSFATAEVGGAGLPKLRTNEPNRYVRFGTTDATISKGNYLNLGTQTWNLQNGFTFVGVVRFYESKNWQRIFDFGNGPQNNNLLCTHPDSSRLSTHVYSGDTRNTITTMNSGIGSWMVIVIRVTNANLLETWKDPSSNLIDNKVTGTGTITSYEARTLTNNWIGRSNWAGDSYACLDIREMAFYDRSLTDSELSDVVSYMRIKHFGDSIPTLGPLSIKSILDFVDPGGSSGENPYAMDKLFRGSRTPKYISSITRIPLAATEPTRISFADFRGAGRTESPADVIGIYAWYTPESWDVGTKSWNDISGNGRHATETRAGTITVGDSTDPLGRSITCISGGTGSGIRFPADVLPETYTLFHLARYSTGGIRKRIFDGLGNNWLSGFHEYGPGVAYHGTSWFTPQENLHGDEWVVSCDTKQLYRSNKVQRNNQIFIGNSTRLTINYGKFVAVESSDWACADVIVFDRELTNAEMLGVEEYLYKKHSLTII
eukprot:gene30983-7090_t